MGQKYGKLGGKKSLETMTAGERSARAKKASLAAAKKTHGGTAGAGAVGQTGEESREAKMSQRRGDRQVEAPRLRLFVETGFGKASPGMGVRAILIRNPI